MAKLSAHGAEIGTLYSATSAKRYMSDGVVLKNQGFGWKIYGKCKPHVSPADAYNNAAHRQIQLLKDRPAYAAYRKLLHATAGLSKRWKLQAAIQAMPDDCDGVWSEACDGYGDNVSASVDEIAELCRAYLAAEAELKSMPAPVRS